MEYKAASCLPYSVLELLIEGAPVENGVEELNKELESRNLARK